MSRGSIGHNMKVTGNWTVEGFFDGRSASRELFEHVSRFIESLGEAKVEAAKTQVSFGARRKFAWVWLPQMWIKKQPENSIVLTLDLSRHVEDRRIKQAVEPRPGRWAHHVVMQKEADLDDTVKGWLREAYNRAQ